VASVVAVADTRLVIAVVVADTHSEVDSRQAAQGQSLVATADSPVGIVVDTSPVMMVVLVVVDT
jgi:hypothetical protein